jgi:succinate-semialdehyde dehydrogenase/glutarate-semialdehyde dehydrogenase
MRSIDPSTGKTLAEYADHDATAVEERIARAVHAQALWARLAIAERAGPLRAAADLLETRKRDLALLMASEMGKPVRQGVAELEKCASGARLAAAEAARWLASETVATEASESRVVYRPLGLVLAIMPWNFPFWQVFRCAGPALMAGNAVLLKHAAGVTGSSLAIEELFRSAELPEGLFASLLLQNDAVAPLLADPRIAGVSLTGSTRAGREVGAAAGAGLKKVVLELGGSDPYLVLEDADLDLAATACAASRLQNAGQSCIAAKRLIVVDGVYEAFVERLLARFRAARVGDPRDDLTEIGPLARADLRETLDTQVRASVEQGARVLIGGEVQPGLGCFYPPTVLADVRPGMPAYAEELFGPVAVLFRASDEAEAIRIANDTRYGLGAAVFTRDLDRGRRIAELELEAGSCFVNALVRSDPRLPFGGVRDSGVGRELGALGMREFTNAKTVVVA